MPARVQHERELHAIGQSIFYNDGGHTNEVHPQGRDKVDWIATAAQAADCLTKSIEANILAADLGYL